MFLKEIFLCSLLCLGALATRARYDNYPVYKATPATESQMKLLLNFEQISDSIIFLHGAHKLGESLNIIVAPHKVPDFLQTLSDNGIKFELIENNFQKHIDEESRTSIARGRSFYGWKNYYDLEATYEYLKQTAQKYSQVELINAGKSYEGRDILGVKVSYKSGNRGIVLEGGIHSREWISPATLTYTLNELLTSNNTATRDIAENYDWYIFPNTNPDGYVYTHKTNRMWRKTRSPNGMCYGADPNRNFDLAWNTVGSSSFPCADTYAGKSAESEIEIKTFTTYMKTLKGKIDLYISFHSFSQLLIFPYGYTSKLTSNHNDLQNIGDVAAAALAKRYGTKYTVGNIYETIYPASGSSIDWVHGVLEVPLAFCYELRPRTGGMDGFMLPASQIIPTGEETLDSMTAMINEAVKLKYFKK